MHGLKIEIRLTSKKGSIRVKLKFDRFDGFEFEDLVIRFVDWNSVDVQSNRLNDGMQHVLFWDCCGLTVIHVPESERRTKD